MQCINESVVVLNDGFQESIWHGALLESGLPHLDSKKFTLTDLSYDENFYDENSLSLFFVTQAKCVLHLCTYKF